MHGRHNEVPLLTTVERQEEGQRKRSWVAEQELRPLDERATCYLLLVLQNEVGKILKICGQQVRHSAV